MKVNAIYEEKKILQFRYKFDNDMYEVKHKCNKLSDINPPPSYKKVVSWTQQKGSGVLVNLMRVRHNVSIKKRKNHM